MVCETENMEITIYKAANSNNQIKCLVLFQSDKVDGFLYLTLLNICPAFIIRFVLQLITILNQKLHTTVFCEFLCLILTFLLFLSSNFQKYLSKFCELLFNLYKAIAVIQIILNFSLTCHALNPLYHMPADTTVVNKAIVSKILLFMEKGSEIKIKHLHYHAQNLMDDLELF